MKTRHWIYLAAVVTLSACASTQNPQVKNIVYDPPPAPESFSLEMDFGPNYSFLIGGRSYSFGETEDYLRRQIAGSAEPYTVLLHDQNDDMKVPGYLCFVVLMHDVGANGYLDSNGKPKAVKTTIAANQYPAMRKSCWNQ